MDPYRILPTCRGHDSNPNDQRTFSKLTMTPYENQPLLIGISTSIGFNSSVIDSLIDMMTCSLKLLYSRSVTTVLVIVCHCHQTAREAAHPDGKATRICCDALHSAALSCISTTVRLLKDLKVNHPKIFQTCQQRPFNLYSFPASHSLQVPCVEGPQRRRTLPKILGCHDLKFAAPQFIGMFQKGTIMYYIQNNLI